MRMHIYARADVGMDAAVYEIEQRIAALRARWPAHSAPPAMWQQLFDLEEELELARHGCGIPVAQEVLEENEEREGNMYGYKRQVDMTYEAAVQKVREELKAEGFGVLTEIDVKDTLKKKLNAEFDKYIILGACNPPLAYQAFQAERDIGLVMPCNVIVYEDRGKTFVSATRPTVTMNVVKSDKLAELAGQVESKLQAVVDKV